MGVSGDMQPVEGRIPTATEVSNKTVQLPAHHIAASFLARAPWNTRDTTPETTKFVLLPANFHMGLPATHPVGEQILGKIITGPL